MEIFKFRKLRMNGDTLERCYTKGKTFIRLFSVNGSDWKDAQNNTWDIQGPGWGNPQMRKG